MPSQPRNILITGGYGFMGSNFIRYLYNKYPRCRIVNFDFLTYAGNPENLKDIADLEEGAPDGERRYQFVKGDVCDAPRLDKLLAESKFDLIVHFAAETHVDRSFYNVSDFVRTNVDGTRILLEALRKHHIPRLVHISTDEVYGDAAEGFSDENAPFRPSNPYAASKACADLLAQAYIKTYKTPAIIIRSSNNFGPYQYPEKLIPMAVTNIMEGKKIPIHGSGKHVRSWLHVDDFAEAVDLVAQNAPAGEIYNLSGEHKTNLEVIGMAANHLRADLDFVKTHTQDRPSADLRYAPDSSKIQRELGWRRRRDLASTMGELTAWYLNNADWWKKIKMKNEYKNHYDKQSKAEWY